jgi:hypothetical protein
VASVVNAVHATATVVTAANAVASVPNVHHAKTVKHKRPHTTQQTQTETHTKHLCNVSKTSVANPKFATSKSLANNAHPAKRVHRVKIARLVKNVRLAVKLLRHRLQQLLHKPHQQPSAACLRCKRLRCLCLSCTPLPKAAVWNG